MDKPNLSNYKGKRRIKIDKLPVNKGNKKLPPKYEDFDGNPMNS